MTKGIDETQINKLIIEAKKLKDKITNQGVKAPNGKVTFTKEQTQELKKVEDLILELQKQRGDHISKVNTLETYLNTEVRSQSSDNTMEQRWQDYGRENVAFDIAYLQKEVEARKQAIKDVENSNEYGEEKPLFLKLAMVDLEDAKERLLKAQAVDKTKRQEIKKTVTNDVSSIQNTGKVGSNPFKAAEEEKKRLEEVERQKYEKGKGQGKGGPPR